MIAFYQKLGEILLAFLESVHARYIKAVRRKLHANNKFIHLMEQECISRQNENEILQEILDKSE